MNARFSYISIACSILLILTCCDRVDSSKEYNADTDSRIIERIFANPDSVTQYIEKSIADDSISAIHGVYLYALYQRYIVADKDSAISLLTSVCNHFQETPPRNKEENCVYADALILITKTYMLQEQYSHALHYAEKASEFLKKQSGRYIDIISDIECVRGNILITMGHEKEGIEIIKQAIENTDTCRTLTGWHAHLNCHLQQLTVLYELDSCNKMIATCDQSLAEIRNARNYKEIPIDFSNEEKIAEFQDFYTGVFEAYRSSAFAKLGQQDSAHASLNRCLKTTWSKRYRLTSISLIRTYISLGMEESLDSAYHYFIESNTPDTMQERLLVMLNGKASILAAKNDYKSAISLYQTIDKAETKIHQKRITEQIQLSEILFKKREAERESRLLAEQKTIVWTAHTVIFSLVILITFYFYYNRKKNKQMEIAYKTLLEKQSIIDTNVKLLTSAESIASNPSTLLYNRIQQVMETSKPYLKEDFSINTLAELLNTNTTYISRAINFASNHTFPQWLAEYRNSIAIRALQDNPNLTINEVSLLTGHNTRETFSRQFKAINGISFSDFKERLSKN